MRGWKFICRESEEGTSVVYNRNYHLRVIQDSSHCPEICVLLGFWITDILMRSQFNRATPCITDTTQSTALYRCCQWPHEPKVNIRCRTYFHSCLVPRVALWLRPSTRAVVGLCTQAGFTGRNLTIGQRAPCFPLEATHSSWNRNLYCTKPTPFILILLL